MINLEVLTLFLLVSRFLSTCIDGTQLHDEILIFMPRLNQFTFSINTVLFDTSVNVHLPSNNDIQNSFTRTKYQQVGSYVDEKMTDDIGRCHAFSLPYQFDRFHLSTCFKGGIFDKVVNLTMHDQHPFEHELFEKISYDFPSLTRLIVINSEPQRNKQHASTLITFTHLTELDVYLTHADYVEQLFLETKSHLPHLKRLIIKC